MLDLPASAGMNCGAMRNSGGLKILTQSLHPARAEEALTDVPAASLLQACKPGTWQGIFIGL
jgi:hypothetical protein